MGNQKIYALLVGLLIGSFRCSSVKLATRSATASSVRESTEESVRIRPKQTVPGFEWVYQSTSMEVEEAQYFPSSARTVIYVADVHVSAYQQRVLQLMNEFKAHGFSGVIGLEGLIGNLSEDHEKTRQQREKVDRLRQESFSHAQKYAFIVQDPLLSRRFISSQLEYCEEPVLPLTPGMAYAFPLVQLFGAQAIVAGVEEQLLYHNWSVSGIKNQLHESLRIAECFYNLQTDVFSQCHAFLDQSYLPPEKREADFISRYRGIRDQKELLREIIMGLRRNYDCLDHAFRGNFTSSEADGLTRLRSGMALKNLLATMEMYHREKGILIFGLGHEEDVLTELSRRNISYLSIMVAKGKAAKQK